MAIKGKGKAKSRSGRVVTAGPRPAYVPPKVPLFQRTGAKFTVALVIEVALFALLVGFGEQSEGDRQRDAVREFGSVVDAALFQGEAVQQLPGTAQVLPQMAPRLTELTGEEPPPAEDVVTEADGWAKGVLEVGESISRIEVPAEELDPDQVAALTEARGLMERALGMYVGLAQQAGIAAQLEGPAQEDLISTIQSQLGVAASLFDAGYGKLQELRQALGVPTSTAPPAGGLPPGVPPGGIPPGAPGGLPPGIEIPPGGIPEGELPPGIEIPPEGEVPGEDTGGGGGGGGGNG